MAGLIYGAAVSTRRRISRAPTSLPASASGTTPPGFDISQTLIAYSASTSTFGRAFWVGLLNTLLVAAIGIVLATVLGFIVGIARLSRNWLVARLAGGYVELIRNVPLLLQLSFWYNAVLKSLPQLRGSVRASRRRYSQQSRPVPAAAGIRRRHFVAVLDRVVCRHRRGDRAADLGAPAPRAHRRASCRSSGLRSGFVVGLPLAAFALAGFPLTFSVPQMGRFNVSGGVEILPEFAALRLALTIYTAAFIAEVVRAGVLAVHSGQIEAAQALGLRSSATLRLVVVPQAMRVIIPPLTSQYLNLIKNSSLGRRYRLSRSGPGIRRQRAQHHRAGG